MRLAMRLAVSGQAGRLHAGWYCRDDLEALRHDSALNPGASDARCHARCRVLAVWNRRETVDSRGGHVWREFWRQAVRVRGLYRVPFDPADAVNTPRGLAVEQPGVREGLRRALALAQQRLTQFNVPLDATLGSI